MAATATDDPGVIDGLTTPVSRLLGRNPGPMTGAGTNSYLIGSETLSLVDPGPQDDVQFERFMRAIGSRRLAYILVTHTHADHSPAAARLQQATGAILVGMPAPDMPGHDRNFLPAKTWQHNAVIDCGEYHVRLIHTPGHVSNHICFLLEEERLLFTGDHVLQGTTSVILPPDGDMTAYMDSLRYLQTLPLAALAPGHGELMREPQAELNYLINHRLQREQKVVQQITQQQPVHLDSLVLSVYDDVAPHLLPWAKKTLLAHLLKLQRDGRVQCIQGNWQLTPMPSS